MQVIEIIDGIIAKKEELCMTNQQLADESDVPKATVDKILSKRTESPTLGTVLKLANAVGYEFPSKTELPPAPVSNADNVAQIRAIYEDRIAAYERLLARDRAYTNRLLAEKNRWIMCLLIICIILVVFICAVVIYDIVNRDIGWVRDQLAQFERGGILDWVLSAFRNNS